MSEGPQLPVASTGRKAARATIVQGHESARRTRQKGNRQSAGTWVVGLVETLEHTKNRPPPGGRCEPRQRLRVRGDQASPTAVKQRSCPCRTGCAAARPKGVGEAFDTSPFAGREQLDARSDQKKSVGRPSPEAWVREPTPRPTPVVCSPNLIGTRGRACCGHVVGADRSCRLIGLRLAARAGLPSCLWTSARLDDSLITSPWLHARASQGARGRGDGPGR